MLDRPIAATPGKISPHLPTRDLFAQAYRENLRQLYAFLLRLGGSPELAEDLAHESFLKAFEAAGSFNSQSSWKTWLFAIALNAFRDHQRRIRLEIQTADEVLEGIPATTPLLSESLANDDEITRLRCAVDALPEELRLPIILVRYQGMHYREAAQVLGITENTLRMRLHRTHKRLARVLDPEDVET